MSKRVNGDRYRTIWNEILFTKIKAEDIGNIWFQHDGASCHTAEATFWSYGDCYRAILNEILFTKIEAENIGNIWFQHDGASCHTAEATFWSYGDRYRAMLNEILFTKIEEEDIGNIWFQQDVATCHTVEAAVDVSRPVFEDRIISRRGDLTPLEYYLWGAVKDSVTPTSHRQLML